uniref:Uncharacterized protein n=1 Tax=Geospiza parvula TaxID=87175 RepID=A0A8U8CDJ3_GEOPR
MGSISAANAEFCFDVFKEVKLHHPNDNIFYCPLSMIAALAMVYLGARNNTEYQMEKVLHFDKIAGLGSIQTKCGKSMNIHLLFKEILSDITAPEANYSLHIANRLYAEKTSQILPIYLKCVKKLYRSGLETVNFKTASNQARQRINSWVKNQTKGKQKRRHSSFPKAAWLKIESCPFKGSVHLSDQRKRLLPHHIILTFLFLQQESRPVQMMRQNSTFKVGRVAEDKIKVLELPYASGELSLLVLLPDDISGLAQLENKISFEKLAEWTSSEVMEKKRVKVYLPRMKIEEKYNLTSVLTSLGMTDLFSPSANLSGISAAESLRVSEAIHEAYMEVTEEGTEEGTGSADDTEDIQYSSEFEEFRADHPFLFLIKHNPSNLILFFGRYCYP